MIGIPDYLSACADDVKIQKGSVSFHIRCACGCQSFALYKNSYTSEEKKIIDAYEASLPKIGWHTLHGGVGKDGKPYCYIRRLFIFKKKVVFPPAPSFANLCAVKALCESCKKEILLYDSRYHGYQAMDTPGEERNGLPFFDERGAAYGNVSVRLEQMEEADVAPRYLLGIWIYRMAGTKKRVCFNAETA